MDERQRRDAGLWYDANYDESLVQERQYAEGLTFKLNRTAPDDMASREKLLKQLLGSLGEHVEILTPLIVDYGYNISVGDWSFINHGAYLMDGAPITIGSHVFIGPNFGAYTAQHPLIAQERNRGLERACPIEIGDDVWIGADVKVLAGVSIGRGSVIGAGSIVTRSIPEGVIALGSPCRVIREIRESDSIMDDSLSHEPSSEV